MSVLKRIGAAAVVTAVGALVLFLDYRQAQEEAHALSFIEPSDIRIEDAVLSGRFDKLTARISNQSDFTINRITIDILLSDCPQPAEDAPPLPKGFILDDCEVIGASEVIEYILVPPSQVRQIDTYVMFEDRPPVKVVCAGAIISGQLERP
ncbi:MAG: hypothetical protein P8L66_01960 [Rhodospirillaceae bacterium]|nr:hypothetical protein [Rhodospirillaceae bacterium]